MKSLEIVNTRLNDLEEKIEIYKSLEQPSDFAKLQMIALENKIYNIKLIKQHLEMLEILLIKSVDLEDLFYLFNKCPGEDEYILECYNDCHKRKLTMEELQKIK